MPFLPDLERKFSKKLKNRFWNDFYPNRVQIGREREKKKKLAPNSIPTRPEQENSQKKIAKKFKKLKNIIPAIFLSKTG